MEYGNNLPSPRWITVPYLVAHGHKVWTYVWVPKFLTHWNAVFTDWVVMDSIKISLPLVWSSLNIWSFYITPCRRILGFLPVFNPEKSAPLVDDLPHQIWSLYVKLYERIYIPGTTGVVWTNNTVWQTSSFYTINNTYHIIKWPKKTAPLKLAAELWWEICRILTDFQNSSTTGKRAKFPTVPLQYN